METESPKEDRKKQEDEDKKRFAAWASRSPIFNGGHSEEDRAQEALNRRRSSAPNAGFVSIYFKWNAQNQAATTAISSTMSSSTMSAVSPSATSITSSSLLPQTNTHTLYTYTPSTDPVAKVAPVELPKLAVPHASISAPFFPTASTMSELWTRFFNIHHFIVTLVKRQCHIFCLVFLFVQFIPLTVIYIFSVDN